MKISTSAQHSARARERLSDARVISECALVARACCVEQRASYSESGVGRRDLSSGAARGMTALQAQKERTAMPEFHETRAGARFYESQLPELITQISRVATALEKLVAEKAKRELPGNQAMYVVTRIDHADTTRCAEVFGRRIVEFVTSDINDGGRLGDEQHIGRECPEIRTGAIVTADGNGLVHIVDGAK